MDTARYVLALIVVVSFPPAVIFWFIVHPAVAFWRRVGPLLTYVSVFTVFIAIMVGLVLVREPLLRTEFGTVPALWPLAVASYLVSVVIEMRCRRHLKFSTLAGMPELTRAGSESSLLTQGIYSRVRHPRYIGVMFSLIGVALFANYLAVYVLVPIVGLGLWLVVVLEERELRDRFGVAYAEYSARVPRFIPRRGAA